MWFSIYKKVPKYIYSQDLYLSQLRKIDSSHYLLSLESKYAYYNFRVNATLLYLHRVSPTLEVGKNKVHILILIIPLIIYVNI